MDISKILTSLPQGLRNPLITEFNTIVQRYLEGDWTPAGLSGGKFCEIVYTILDGYSSGAYANKPSKPANFVDACRKLESKTGVPRSFQILIPRILPALYEIRNNRNVGHVGGDVDPNLMDSAAVVSISTWVMAELVRVFHSVSTLEAQEVVTSLSEYKIPLVWTSDNVKRILIPNFQLKDQILILLVSTSGNVTEDDLISWTESKNKKHFNSVLNKLHAQRMIEYDKRAKLIEILPPGVAAARTKIAKYSN